MWMASAWTDSVWMASYSSLSHAMLVLTAT